MPSAPPITRETANIFRERALEGRFAKKNREIAELQRKLAEALGPRTEDDLRRKERLLMQVKKCDDLLEDCDEPKAFAQLVSAKARLWELFNPKPGVLKSNRRQERQVVQPIDAHPEPQQPSKPLGWEYDV